MLRSLIHRIPKKFHKPHVYKPAIVIRSKLPYRKFTKEQPEHKQIPIKAFFRVSGWLISVPITTIMIGMYPPDLAGISVILLNSFIMSELVAFLGKKLFRYKHAALRGGIIYLLATLPALLVLMFCYNAVEKIFNYGSGTIRRKKHSRNIIGALFASGMVFLYTVIVSLSKIGFVTVPYGAFVGWMIRKCGHHFAKPM